MAMKYDPIMCMMVDDSVKTKDGLYDPEKNARYEMKKEGQYFKIYKNGKLVGMKSTEEEAAREAARHRAANDRKTIDHAIRSCDSREDDIADELFDALQQIGKRNINKNEAEFISEKFFDGKVSSDELMRIFNKYKKEYL